MRHFKSNLTIIKYIVTWLKYSVTIKSTFKLNEQLHKRKHKYTLTLLYNLRDNFSIGGIDNQYYHYYHLYHYHYYHSWAGHATVMVSKECLYFCEHVVIIFFTKQITIATAQPVEMSLVTPIQSFSQTLQNDDLNLMTETSVNNLEFWKCCKLTN